MQEGQPPWLLQDIQRKAPNVGHFSDHRKTNTIRCGKIPQVMLQPAAILRAFPRQSPSCHTSITSMHTNQGRTLPMSRGAEREKPNGAQYLPRQRVQQRLLFFFFKQKLIQAPKHYFSFFLVSQPSLL